MANSSNKSGTSKDRIESISKKYTQFSKKVVAFCLINLVAIELFAMVMIARTGDTSQIGFLITSIAVECVGCVIWYMKNSEGEKKARIQAEIERAKLGNSSADNSSCKIDCDADIPTYNETLYEGNSSGESNESNDAVG